MLSPSPSKKGIHLTPENAFSMPVLSPMIGMPPPYRYKDSRVVNILFKSDVELLRKLVPSPLELSPDPLVILYIGLFQFTDVYMPYHEAGLLLPITHAGRNGQYPLVLYLDKPNPIVGGREIYGWPKKEAEDISFREEQGMIQASVTRYGQEIIDVRFEARQKIDPIPQRPPVPMFTLKYIPSAIKDAPPDVLKLISSSSDPDFITQMQIGEAALRFGPSPYDDLLARIPIEKVVYAEVITHDFTLGYGELVVDYLSSTEEQTNGH